MPATPEPPGLIEPPTAVNNPFTEPEPDRVWFSVKLEFCERSNVAPTATKIGPDNSPPEPSCRVP